MGKQSDAHEFLVFFLEKLDSCLRVENSFLVDEVFGGYFLNEVKVIIYDDLFTCFKYTVLMW